MRTSPWLLRTALVSLALVAVAACEPQPPTPGPVPKPVAAVVKPVAQVAAPTPTTVPYRGEYRFARTDFGGRPVRWNPCRPVPYVLNRTGAPAFVVTELNAAVAAIESATGIDLVFAGTTTERPSVDRPLRDARYGSGYSPILISFATAAELPFSSPTASAWAPSWTEVDPLTRVPQLVSGMVVLRPDHGWTQGLHSANPLRLMLQHELAHVMGLAHVHDAREVMSTHGNGTARAWGPGDLQGLKLLGRSAGCLNALS